MSLYVCMNIIVVVGRRHISYFLGYVEKADTSLKAAIIDKELSKIIVKCLYAYRLLLEYTCTGEFLNKCPQYFKDNIDDMSHETDYIHMLLSLGPTCTYSHIAHNISQTASYNCHVMYFVCHAVHQTVQMFGSFDFRLLLQSILLG